MVTLIIMALVQVPTSLYLKEHIYTFVNLYHIYIRNYGPYIHCFDMYEG